MNRAPFPYAGGKATVASVVWQQFGDVDHYIEPFAGGLGVLLNRPESHDPRSETVNDIDALLTNAWRGIQMFPDQVAAIIEAWPVNELDMQARNRQMIEVRNRGDLDEALRGDPRYCDVELAAWWVWGRCAWPGGRWTVDDHNRRMQLNRPGCGVHTLRDRDRLYSVFESLSERLRHTRICCGDWRRVLTAGAGGALACGSTVGVLLDPPYSHDGRDGDLYSEEMADASEVREWAAKEGDEHGVRVALCGIVGEHDMAPDWTTYKWTSPGFGSNECIWFSPHCLGGVEQMNFLRSKGAADES